MKRPSFQFYPGDWQANSNLRRCTHAEKGAWLDVMCLMHDQPEYGQLRWPLKEIAQAIGATPATLRALVTKGVMKGDDKQVVETFVYTPRSGRRDGEPVTLVPTQPGPLWYSSRMVKDEYVRTIRGESTRFGDGNGDASKSSPKPPFGDGSSSSSSSSTSPSLRSGEEAGKPPRAPGRQKSEARTLATYLAECKAAHAKPVPDDHHVRRWADEAGLQPEMLQIAWVQFRERYTEGEKGKGKRYKDWPGHFATAVKDNWFGLWYVGDRGAMCWTSKGLTHKTVLDARMAQQEADHAPA